MKEETAKSIINFFLIAAIALASGFIFSYLSFSDVGEDIYDQVQVAVASFDTPFGKKPETPKPLPASATQKDTPEESEENAGEIELGHIKENYFADELQDGKVIVADLDSMTMTLVEGGEEMAEYEILSKGKPGSPWETPSGKYRVSYKEENHFSSIGEVWMPYSIQFYGNFFIHGWPYYPGGKAVSEGYSGGCIRLSSDDAASVYSFADTKTDVLIYGDGLKPVYEAFNQNYFRDRTEPRVNADAYLVADLSTGQVILEKSRSKILPIASISKLMTALVSLEVVNQFQEAYVSERAVGTEGYSGALIAEEYITTGDLLYPLLLSSSNDAAEVIAEHYGRKRFIDQMNERAQAIGLSSTHFSDPSGLSSENVSSPEDLFKLAQHIHRHKNYIFDVTKLKSKKIDTHLWANNSRFVSDERYLGGKNGFTTEAGKTVMALFKLPLAEFESRDIAIILLDTGDITTEVRRIVNYLQKYVHYGTKLSKN